MHVCMRPKLRSTCRRKKLLSFACVQLIRIKTIKFLHAFSCMQLIHDEKTGESCHVSTKIEFHYHFPITSITINSYNTFTVPAVLLRSKLIAERRKISPFRFWYRIFIAYGPVNHQTLTQNIVNVGLFSPQMTWAITSWFSCTNGWEQIHTVFFNISLFRNSTPVNIEKLRSTISSRSKPVLILIRLNQLPLTYLRFGYVFLHVSSARTLRQTLYVGQAF